MTNTSSETPAQVTSTEPQSDAAREELEDILHRARNAAQEIEVGVDELNSCMVELLWSDGLSEDAQVLINDIGAEANELFANLDKHLDGLRREIIATEQ
jgi:hypothetical protein